MTCTHAALKRKELVTMGFKYDNILMEESAQVKMRLGKVVSG
jgi:intron-binding protein aquarius